MKVYISNNHDWIISAIKKANTTSDRLCWCLCGSQNWLCDLRLKYHKFLSSLYCTLLFCRKENLTFSGVAMLAVHCKCLAGCNMFVWGYRPFKSDIYLLAESGNKGTKTRCKVCSHLATSALKELTVFLLVFYQFSLSTFLALFLTLF